MSETLIQVRRTVQLSLFGEASNGAAESLDDESQEIVETILIQDGFYLGRAFRHSPRKAVWIDGEDHLLFFADENAEGIRVPLLTGGPSLTSKECKPPNVGRAG